MKEDKNQGKNHYGFTDLIKAGLSIFTTPQFNTIVYKDSKKKGSIFKRIRAFLPDTSKARERFDTFVTKGGKRKFEGKTEEEILEIIKKEAKNG